MLNSPAGQRCCACPLPRAAAALRTCPRDSSPFVSPLGERPPRPSTLSAVFPAWPSPQRPAAAGSAPRFFVPSVVRASPAFGSASRQPPPAIAWPLPCQVRALLRRRPLCSLIVVPHGPRSYPATAGVRSAFRSRRAGWPATLHSGPLPPASRFHCGRLALLARHMPTLLARPPTFAGRLSPLLQIGNILCVRASRFGACPLCSGWKSFSPSPVPGCGGMACSSTNVLCKCSIDAIITVPPVL